jgi:crotonobetainyl-CoA:carnitine CoA-transferase CaiB-like acyl-CoA transferase
MAGVLEGIRVISMGQVVAVPAASSIMADWGAEVIKLEPLSGEMLRGTVRLQGRDVGQINWIIQVLNRNTKGLAVDLKKESGRDIVHKLVKQADVFMSNYEIGSIAKLKLDYATLSKLNPKLVYAVVNGYGATGPDKDERGYDFAAGWARSGIMHLMGEPGDSPVSQRAGMVDSIAGAHIVGAVCAALLQKERTGKGQELDISLYHTGVWTICMDMQTALTGKDPLKHDRARASNPIFNSYRTKDNRWFWLAMLQSDASWPDFCQAVERPDLINDPRYNNMQARTQNNAALISLIEEIIASRNLEEWEEPFRRYKVIYGRVQTPVEVTADPQALANNFFPELEYPGAGKKRLVATPVNFHQDPAAIRTPAPEVGQHTEEILLELGYNWDDIARLKDEKVIL